MHELAESRVAETRALIQELRELEHSPGDLRRWREILARLQQIRNEATIAAPSVPRSD